MFKSFVPKKDFYYTNKPTVNFCEVQENGVLPKHVAMSFFGN